VLDLTAIRAAIFDMDGVLWRGSQTLNGAPATLDFLRAQVIPFTLATNNSSRSVAEYVARCADGGLIVTADQIVTSAVVTAEAIARDYPSGTPILVIGSESLAASLAACGYPIDEARAQIVIVGLDVNITYSKLSGALRRLLAGADFIGTNADPTFPLPDGLAPGAGSLIAALETAAGRPARIMGKPHPAMFLTALSRLGTTANETLLIGDRLDTDILGAQQAGLRTALVLTGVTTPADLARADQPIQPEAVFADLIALRTAWEAARQRSRS